MTIVSSDKIVWRIGIITEQLHWVSLLQDCLADDEYQLVYATIDTPLDPTIDNKLDAVIGVLSPKVIEALTVLGDHHPSIPIIALLPEDISLLPDDPILALADSLLPATPIFMRQIVTTLRLHLGNKRLETQINLLENDVTTQRRITNDIELLKNAIVRNVSHELRTPLLQVKSAVALIADEVPESKLIDYAENAVGRLETHVKNITMLGQTLNDMNLNPIILRDAVEYAKRHIRRVWQLKDSIEHIEMAIEPNLPPVLADKQGLSTVMQLLIDNALKFTSEGRDIKITIIGRQHNDKQIYIAVKDNGIGIAADKIKKIFGSFYQVDSSPTRRYGGAGVGLAIVRLILDRHNSAIEVDTVEGKGSTFYFLLPSVNLDDYDKGLIDFD